MPDRGKSSIVCAALLLCALTACTSTPAARPEVKIPTFDSSPSSVVPTTPTAPTTDDSIAPIIEPPSEPPPPPPSTTPKPRPKPTPKPTPPPQTPPPQTPPPSTTITFPDHFVKIGAPCQQEGAIGFTREGDLAICRRDSPRDRTMRWTLE
ncbi:hypothetical protein [Actinocrispum wychmicini]|uniref:Uncharacterized protein n=1 Tax=Actinocrispum wychmicini TaxID=1213861 RepID=A0A4R2IY88_9PSEU|nr:hypothetical protein [Actinocrispum wychmicini]TCO50911.1 hypothetical protein EV192_113294 [Actinocrispum wychmicini]